MKITQLQTTNEVYPYRSVPPDLIEYLEVHVGKANERQNACVQNNTLIDNTDFLEIIIYLIQFSVIFACGESRVPDLGERVPEDEGGVPPRLGHLYLPLARHVGLVRLIEGHLPGSKVVGIRNCVYCKLTRWI